MDLTYWLISLLSAMFGSITGLLVTVLVLLLVRMYANRPSNLPPGPVGLPGIGYLNFMRGHLAMGLAKTCETYGPITSFYLGSNLVVVLGDYDSMRKAFVDQGDTFSGRPQILIDKELAIEAKSLINADGQFWNEHRRFALSTLRDFGLGKSSLEAPILDEISFFLDEINKKQDVPFDVHQDLATSICNIICILNFGHRFEYNDPRFLRIKEGLETEKNDVPRASLLAFIPLLAKIPRIKKILRLEPLFRHFRYMYEMMAEEAQQHKKDYHDGKKDDYIDAYFTERNERQRTNNHADMFDDDALLANLRTLFVAGMESTTTTLRWGLLYMVLHQDIQKKVQQEINNVIGPDRSPSMENRLRMPYTEATLMEVQRIRTIVPLTVPHRAMKDTLLEGYHIPQGTVVSANLWAVHNDPKLYPDPESFRPERFINQDGKAVRPEHLVIFGMGKRQCLGEALARMELFLYFTSMLQKFTFTKPEGSILTTDIVTGIVDCPQSYKLVALPRD